MGFFVEPETVLIEFSGQFQGWKVLLKKEMDAGDQEELENTMLGIEMDGVEGKTPRPVLKQGGLKLLELNVLKILPPEGPEIIPSSATLRKLARPVRAKLLEKIAELNRPFVGAGEGI